MVVEPSQGCIPVPYRRRRPDKTVLYGVVQAHFETYLCRCNEGTWDGSAVPAHVEREFRRYLDCGMLARETSKATQQHTEKKHTEEAAEALWRSSARYLWAMLLARIYESAPLACPHCITDYVWGSSTSNYPSDYLSTTSTSRTGI